MKIILDNGDVIELDSTSKATGRLKGDMPTQVVAELFPGCNVVLADGWASTKEKKEKK